ncbi:MAG TPA: M28 family peptidase [Thermoanaerobaculia bacterium]|nr:M28 family peptidase [Thermoanaerobaculia bacterium]
MRSSILALWLGAFASCALAQSADSSDRAAAQAAIKTIRADAIRAHMRFLSDDLLGGRFPGTAGHEIAARYVATELEGMGVQPAGEHGTWFQKVPCRRGAPDAMRSSISLSRPGEEVALKDPEDYWYYSDVVRTDSLVEAPVVFVGYGITAPEMHYDDYAGIDARGKIVALISNAPPTFPSSQAGYYAELARKSRNAVAHGAVGRLEIFLPDDDVDISGDGDWLERDGTPHNAVPGIRAWAWLKQQGAEKLFEGAPMSLDQVFAEARAGRPHAFPLAWTAKMHAVNAHESFEASNVVGKITGSDPHLRDQYVIYTAHIDHLGVHTGAEGERCLAAEGSKDRICHGTMDNASGVAGLLEIARAYMRLPVAPRRSILFLFPTGEEDMFEGSDYFAHFPTIPAAAMVADINIDMLPGMIYACRDLTIEGAEHSTLIENATRAALLTGYTLSPDNMPQMNFFVRSDQYPFVLQGVPAVMVRRGVDGNEVARKWLVTRYHTPLDNMEQPIEYEAGVRSAGMIFLMGYDVAQQEKRPTWNPNDFYGRPAGK